MKYKCLIADDEKLARELIRTYISQLPNLELVEECKDGVEVIKAMQNHSIDILFLDIQMPHLKGTEVVRSISNNMPEVIFTTAYDNYALEAFDLNATDYLLKPFSFERFVTSVNKAITKISSAINNEIESKPAYIMVKSDYKLVKIKFEDILYIEALREYIRIFTSDAQIVTLETMKKMEEVLPSNLFIRIHKSFIVAFDRIKALYGNQIDIADQTLPIGRTYRKQLIEKLEQ